MKIIPSFGEFATKGKAAFKRFPVVISWAILGTLFALYTIETEATESAFNTNVLLTFILGISWLIGTRFFVEQFHPKKKWILIIPIIALLLFYVYLPNNETHNNTFWIRFLLYLFAGHLFVFVAPFIVKWDKITYFNYIETIFIAIARSVFFSLILYLGIILALAAFDNLFNVSVDGKRYFQIFVLCLGIVNTWIYLADFPKDIYKNTQLNYNKAVEVFVKYILIPLVILYLIILYAYGFKILIRWNLPKGWVSYLVIALAFLGFFIQLLINPVQKTIDSRAIKRFYPWFYRLLLPLNLLLFVAIFRRIFEYGFTEKRYFVLTLAVWILAMTLYMLLSKKKQIRVFPLSLTLITLFISVGFWGAFSVSTKSQIHRFEKVYNTMKSKDFKVFSKEKQQFNSIIKYLGKKDELDKLTPILGFNPTKGIEEKNYWKVQNLLAKKLGIKVVVDSLNPLDIIEAKSNYFYLKGNGNELIKVKGYDYLKTLHISNKNTSYNTVKGYRIFAKKNTLFIKKDSISYQIPLHDFINNLIQNSEYQYTDIDHMTLEKEFKTLKMKLIFNNISFKPADKNQQTPIFNYGYAQVLLKEK